MIQNSSMMRVISWWAGICLLFSSFPQHLYALAPQSGFGTLFSKAHRILAEYGITDIQGMEELFGGIGGTYKPLLVHTAKGDFVLRRWPIPKEKVRFIVSATNRLHEKHEPFAALVKKTGNAAGRADDFIAEYEGDCYLVEEFKSEGHAVPLEALKDYHLRELGGMAARINNALDDFVPEGEKRWKPREQIFQETEKALAAYRDTADCAAPDERTDGQKLFLENYGFIAEQMCIFRTNYNADLRSRLVPGIVHNDLHPGNVKFNEDGEITAVLDLGYLQTDVRILEFNNLVLGMDKLPGAPPYSREKLFNMLKSYQKKANRKLDGHEIRGVLEILRLRFMEELWFRFVAKIDRLAMINVENGPQALASAAETIEKFKQFAEDFRDESVVRALIKEITTSEYLEFETRPPVTRTFDLESTSIALAVAPKVFDASGKGRIFWDRISNRQYLDGEYAPWAQDAVHELFLPVAGTRASSPAVGSEPDLTSAYEAANPDMEILGILPNGNLGMNDWFVGVADGKVYRSQKEDLEHRSYDMLVATTDGPPRVMRLKFVGSQGQSGIFNAENPDQDIRDQILCAVYGQRIVKNGKINLEAIADQFDDLRHLFRLPIFFVGAREIHLGVSDQQGELYKDASKIRHALRGEAITLSLSPLARYGISESEREGIFTAWGYKNVTGRKGSTSLGLGEYVVDQSSNTMAIRLLPGIHPHSVFGIRSNGSIFTAAVPGKNHFQGITLQRLAEDLIAQGAQDAFLWANGKDVAMHVKGEEPVLTEGARQKALELFLVVRQKNRTKPVSRSEDDNVSAGTICESGHHGAYSALDEQLTRNFDAMRAAYNKQIHPALREAIQQNDGVNVRMHIPDKGPNSMLTEMEADVACVFLGYLENNEFVGLQRLRKKMKQSEHYREAVAKTGHPIAIYFSPPDSGTTLFWHKKSYAAGHANTLGTRIHVSLPLAIEDANTMVRQSPGQTPKELFSVEIAKHEALHIAEGRHDPSLDLAMAKIAEMDKRRPFRTRMIVHVSMDGHGDRLECSQFTPLPNRLQDMNDLHEAIENIGWHGLYVPQEDLPKDVIAFLQSIFLKARGKKVSFWDLLRVKSRDYLLVPHLMEYHAGVKVIDTVGAIELSLQQKRDLKLPENRAVCALGTLTPSDALKTGQRFQRRNGYEISHLLAGMASSSLMQELFQRDMIRGARESWALQRLYYLALAEYLSKHFSQDDKVKEMVDKQFRGILLRDAEQNIRTLNRELGLWDQNLEVAPEVLERIVTMVKSSPRLFDEPSPQRSLGKKSLIASSRRDPCQESL